MRSDLKAINRHTELQLPLNKAAWKQNKRGGFMLRKLRDELLRRFSPAIGEVRQFSIHPKSQGKALRIDIEALRKSSEVNRSASAVMSNLQQIR